MAVFTFLHEKSDQERQQSQEELERLTTDLAHIREQQKGLFNEDDCIILGKRHRIAPPENGINQDLIVERYQRN